MIDDDPRGQFIHISEVRLWVCLAFFMGMFTVHVIRWIMDGGLNDLAEGMPYLLLVSLIFNSFLIWAVCRKIKEEE